MKEDKITRSDTHCAVKMRKTCELLFEARSLSADHEDVYALNYLITAAQLEADRHLNLLTTTTDQTDTLDQISAFVLK